MVALSEIRASNALINDATAPRVSVFVGGTSGVGKLTIKALVETGASLRIYIVGRPSSRERTEAFIEAMRAANPKAELVWVEGEVSLLAEAKTVCASIAAREASVDLLFLSTGYAPFGEREETAEGIEICQSLEYYARVLFTLHLLPLLRAARDPRVVTVLSGGLERASMQTDDLDGLAKPGFFGAVKAQVQYGHLNSVGFDHLAQQNPAVTFVHAWPGWVDTGNVDRFKVDPNSLLGWFIRLVLKPIIRIMSMTDDAAGQRCLFQCTSASIGGRGVSWSGKPGLSSLERPDAGLFLVNHKGDCTPNAKNMASLRKSASAKVWAHTEKVLGPYL